VPDFAGNFEARYAVTNPDGSYSVLGRSVFAARLINASVNGPQNATAGSSIQVSWVGPNNNGDYITIVKRGASEGSYNDYFYTRNANPGTLRAPTEAGSYEIRYNSGSGGRTLASQNIELTARSLSNYSVRGPQSAAAGNSIQVSWAGANDDGDYITIVKRGAPEGSYNDYFYTRNANPGTLRAPTEAGSYEIRYNSGSGGRTLASQNIELTAIAYSVIGPQTATAGSSIQVSWVGPNNPRDYVTIVPKGAPLGSYTSYFYTRDANPGILNTPLQPGEYELRYATEISPAPTLASQVIVLTPIKYGLQAPAQAKVGSPISITWQGSGGRGEYVTIVKKGTATGNYGPYFYTRNGNPGVLTAPSEPGDYEIWLSSEGISPNPTLFRLAIQIVR
jgi:Ca-activated chloride channel homolog